MRRNLFRACAVIVALMLLPSLPSVTKAYVLEGYQWQSAASLTFWNYSASPYDGTAWGAAAQAWTNTPTPVWITSASSKGSEDIAGYSVYRSDVSWDGLTTPYLYNGYLTYAVEDLNDYYTDSYSLNKRQSVSVHEFGHALGLAHPTGTQGAVIMNKYTCGATSRWCTYSVKTPQTDDINGINAIY